MASQPDDDKVTRYLLGDTLPEADVELIEEHYIHNEAYFDALQRIEDRLIDDFLDERLSHEQQELFERTFMSSARRRKRVEIQRGMKSAIDRRRLRASEKGVTEASSAAVLFRPGKVGGAFRWALGAACGIAVVSLAAVAWRQHVEIGNLRAVASVAVRSAAPRTTVELPGLVLEPGLLQGAGSVSTLKIRPEVPWVSIRLRIPREFQSDIFQVTLESAAGQPIWTLYRTSPVRQESEFLLPLDLQSALLTRGDYVVAVSRDHAGRSERLPSYVFRVD